MLSCINTMASTHTQDMPKVMQGVPHDAKIPLSS